jgi:hypothetical protein
VSLKLVLDNTQLTKTLRESLRECSLQGINAFRGRDNHICPPRADRECTSAKAQVMSSPSFGVC